MNIAILTPTFSHFSGPDRVVEQQAQQLRAQGHTVMIIALAAEMDPPPGVRLITLGMPRQQALQRLYRLLFFVDILKIRKAAALLNKTDRVISHMYPMTLIAQRAKKKHALQYTYYNMGVAYPHLFRNILERLYIKLFRSLTAKTVRTADAAVSISSFLREELKKETGVEGSVELCIVDSRFHPGVDPAPVRQTYTLGYPVLLYVGRLSPHKGIHLLLNSFRIVQQRYPNATLLIAGKPTFPKYYQELQRGVQGKTNIIFTGFVDDRQLPSYYAACDVYTTATLWEGFNLPAAEAQACGKPVVAFDIGAHQEVIHNGTLVKPGDTQAFADAVIAVVENTSKVTTSF